MEILLFLSNVENLIPSLHAAKIHERCYDKNMFYPQQHSAEMFIRHQKNVKSVAP